MNLGITQPLTWSELGKGRHRDGERKRTVKECFSLRFFEKFSQKTAMMLIYLFIFAA